MAKIQFSLNVPSDIVKRVEIQEVSHVVDSAIDRLLAKAKTVGSNQPVLEIQPEKAAAWIPAEIPSASKIDDESEQISSVDEVLAESDELVSADDKDGDTESSEEDVVEEESEVASSYLGIPDEASSGLRNTDITLDESQVSAIGSLLTRQYGCLIGAAGTGKTTCTKELLHRLIYDENTTFKLKKVGVKYNIAMVAFTGMATQVIKQNLPEWLHGCVSTIHGLLEFAPTRTMIVDKKNGTLRETQIFMPQRNAEFPCDIDLLIIDEASMLGMDLWNQLRIALKPGTRVIMIGDLNQLPPIIGEPIFAYAMSQWPVAELTHVHRQKGNAGKIVEIAHAVLNGDRKAFVPDSMTNPEWRFISAKLDPKGSKAHEQIVGTVNKLRTQCFTGTETRIYDPMRDRIMTAGNGYEKDGMGYSEADYVQQDPINNSLSLIFRKSSPENPRYIIDAGRVQRHFFVGDRVMMLKNDPPSTVQRVTNGMTGVIEEIYPNDDYTGDKHKVGPDFAVRAYIKESFHSRLTAENGGSRMTAAEMDAGMEIDIDELTQTMIDRLAELDEQGDEKKVDRQNWASHTVVVRFANGAVRTLWSKMQLESLSLAYASTVAKCQGSQFPTAIIIVHHAQKQQLSREWLYTAITRAQGHVILMFTEFGIAQCFAKQKIVGANIQEKVARYLEFYKGVETPLGGIMRRNIVLTVGPHGDE